MMRVGAWVVVVVVMVAVLLVVVWAASLLLLLLLAKPRLYRGAIMATTRYHGAYPHCAGVR